MCCLLNVKNFLYKDCLAIPDGFLEAGEESIYETSSRELYEETGVKVSDGIKLRQLITVGSPDRDRKIKSYQTG